MNIIWTWVNVCLNRHIFSSPGHRSGVSIIGSQCKSKFWRSVHTFHSHWQYTWVPSSPNFPSTIICHFDYCQPSRSGVSNCGLYLNSPGGWQSWGFSPIHIDHFSTLSGKMSIYLISRVKLGCLSFHYCVAKLFFKNMHSGRTFHLWYIIWVYSSCC